jgi:hypothetical protein
MGWPVEKMYHQPPLDAADLPVVIQERSGCQRARSCFAVALLAVPTATDRPTALREEPGGLEKSIQVESML